MLALIFHGRAVVLECITSMQVLFFQRANLLVFLVHPHFQVSTTLTQASVTSELGLQAALARTQFACMDVERCLKVVVLTLQVR
ncbi:hypothetical protein D3C84_1170990 [compost metagenome]